MNREEIFKKLDSLKLDKEKYIVLSGASLVAQQIISKTEDIDLCTSFEYYQSIDWPTKIGAFGVEIKYYDCFEISNNLYDENNVILVNGYRFSNLQNVLKVKKKLNREKDQQVIKILEKNVFVRLH